jgi:hypothetical protein
VFASKQEMENADYACSTKPSEGLLHGIECDIRERPTPILYTSTLNGAPVTSTNLGTLQVATQGCSVAGVTLGELWVSYDITFFKKQLHDSPYSAPMLISVGTSTAGATYWPSLGVTSREITLEQIIGVGSRIHLNNPVIGVKYLVTYFMVDSTTVDETALTTGLTAVSCTVAQRLGAPTGASTLRSS